MPVAIGECPVAVLAAMESLGKSYRVESSPSSLGVTIMLPSALIQCACGCTLSPEFPTGMNRLIDVAPGKSSTISFAPFCHEHLNQLSPSREQRTECLRRLIWQGA